MADKSTPSKPSSTSCRRTRRRAGRTTRSRSRSRKIRGQEFGDRPQFLKYKKLGSVPEFFGSVPEFLSPNFPCSMLNSQLKPVLHRELHDPRIRSRQKLTES